MKKIVSLLVILLFSTIILSCDSSSTVTYHHKIYKKSDNELYTVWTVMSGVKLDNGFVCWRHDNGANMCVSGEIIIVPIENKITIDTDGVKTNG